MDYSRDNLQMSFSWSCLPLSWSLKILECNRSSLVANSLQLRFMMFYRISDSSNLSFNIFLNSLNVTRKKISLGLFPFHIVVLLYSTKVSILLACSWECWCQHWQCSLEPILTSTGPVLMFLLQIPWWKIFLSTVKSFLWTWYSAIKNW